MQMRFGCRSGSGWCCDVIALFLVQSHIKNQNRCTLVMANFNEERPDDDGFETTYVYVS